MAQCMDSEVEVELVGGAVGSSSLYWWKWVQFLCLVTRM